jgi:hypothetical protein
MTVNRVVIHSVREWVMNYVLTVLSGFGKEVIFTMLQYKVPYLSVATVRTFSTTWEKKLIARLSVYRSFEVIFSYLGEVPSGGDRDPHVTAYVCRWDKRRLVHRLIDGMFSHHFDTVRVRGFHDSLEPGLQVTDPDLPYLAYSYFLRFGVADSCSTLMTLYLCGVAFSERNLIQLTARYVPSPW